MGPNIMIAVDETEESIDAVKTAYDLFGDRANYTVVSVGEFPNSAVPLTPLGAVPNTFGLRDSWTVDALEEQAERLVSEAAEELEGDPATETEVGPAGVAICEMAGEHEADVLVIGSHDRSFFERLIQPSVGRYLVENAPCPVLVVRS